MHEYIKEMNRKTFGGKDVLTVGETWGVTPEIAKLYANPDEMNLIWYFNLIFLMDIKRK